MRRGRGKGKKQNASALEDRGSGEEENIPAYRRRGRPQKPMKDDFEAEEEEEEEEEEMVEKMEEEEEVDDNGSITSKKQENERKRKIEDVSVFIYLYASLKQYLTGVIGLSEANVDKIWEAAERKMEHASAQTGGSSEPKILIARIIAQVKRTEKDMLKLTLGVQSDSELEFVAKATSYLATAASQFLTCKKGNFCR